MILKINRVEFLKGIAIVEKTISENKVKPVISCTYMEARSNELFFCGTNLETTIITTIPCNDITAEGKIVFQHQMVEEYVKELKDEVITLSINDGNLLIEGEDSSSEFVLMDPEDYPKIPIPDNFDGQMENFKSNAGELADMFEKVKFAASVSSENISINCIKMESEGNVLRFITTDTYRLAFLESELDNINREINVSIPLSTVDSVIKLLKTIPEKEVKFYCEDGKVYFKIDSTLTISRVIDLQFPNYKMILDNNKNNYDKKLMILNDEFSKILKRVIIFVRNNSESKYGATFTLEGNKMTVYGESDLAKISESGEVNYQGESMKIALNAKFILDFVQNLDRRDDIVMELINSNNSVRITSNFESHETVEDQAPSDDNAEAPVHTDPITMKEKKYIYVVMPLALKR